MEASIARVISGGWNALAEAQSALAHTCVVMLTVKSAKLTFMFESYKAQTQVLQQQLEEVWINVDSTFPIVEAKAAIRDLRVRLKDYLLSIHSELIVHKDIPKSAPRTSSPSSSKRNSRRSSSISGSGGEESLDETAYHDAVQHIRGLTAVEKTELLDCVFGQAFGGSQIVYTPSGNFK